MKISVPPKQGKRAWIYEIILIYILLMGAYFRFVGINWGEYQYLHPDERFLIWVGTDISPVKSLADYFDTANSSLNPNNRGHGFYVYGTLPMFMARYLVQEVYGHSGFNEMTNVGRALSAILDLLTVFFVFLVGERLYNKRVGLLGAAFYALMVLPIQQSHYFTTDTFINFFTFLAIFFSVVVVTKRWEESRDSETNFFSHPLFLSSLLFGVALGCAVASKISAVPVAIMLPGAMLVRVMQMPPEKRVSAALRALPYLGMAAIVSVLVFRIFQPYAFSGPGFFGVTPNPSWVAQMRELQAGSAGDIDYPFALQWARRPVWFSGENLVLWGVGLPLGILAWAGFLWMGWRILKGEWKQHILLWGWVAFYFIWQSLAFNPTMRYQLPIYPALAVFAGWAVIQIWERGRKQREEGAESGNKLSGFNFQHLAALFAGFLVLLLTFAWAFAFTRIYVRPITRVAASRWIYQNVPGPINLQIQTPSGMYNQPMNFPEGYTIQPGSPYLSSFTAQTDGSMSAVTIGYLVDQSAASQNTIMQLIISKLPGGAEPLASSVINTDLTMNPNRKDQSEGFSLDRTIQLNFQEKYYLTLEVQTEARDVSIDGPVTLNILNGSTQINQQLANPTNTVGFNRPYNTSFTALQGGTLSEIYLANVIDQAGAPGSKTLRLEISDPAKQLTPVTAQLVSSFAPGTNVNQQSYQLKLSQPIQLIKGNSYNLSLILDSQQGSITLRGMGIANESDFDDAIPENLDGFSNNIYPIYSFQMYWDETPDKLARFLNVMNNSEYIMITSNRQWGSITRIPERYPMATIYYRDLLGCPSEQDLLHCYDVAQPGTYQGNLGYDLVQVYQSDPGFGPIQINDQSAEEAFTVYDHPKVFIFKKNASFNLQIVQSRLGVVDFSHVIHLTPKKANSYPSDLMLPSDRWAVEQLGGTWSKLFNSDALQNRVEILGVILWYVALWLLGLLVYPILRLALPGLRDRGYPLARIFGLLLMAYLVWIAGSASIPATRLNISLILLVIAVIGIDVAYIYRDELMEEWRTQRRYFLIVEGLFLAFFVFDLLIRFGNPDLWHPNFGGEKPMDFSYFNAVIKSTYFPPYDPWFAGGYLNYYYYGFVLFGMLVKWLGIVPSFAYNLIIPTVFSLIAMGAFSIAWNIFQGIRSKAEKGGKEAAQLQDSDNLVPMTETSESGPPGTVTLPDGGREEVTSKEKEISEEEKPSMKGEPSILQPAAFNLSTFLVGLSGALLMAVLGNEGTVRMIYRGYQRLAAPGGVIDNASLPTRIVWAIRGAFIALSGKPLPYYLGDWYWIPSRVMPPNDLAITEFPFFTVLYADPHAHLFAMPVALLALGWAVSLVLSRGQWKRTQGIVAGFLVGGLAIGALYPINLSDIYSYLPLGLVALTYVIVRYIDVPGFMLKIKLPDIARRLLLAAGAVLILILLAFFLYEPYRQWYAQAYRSIEAWKGSRTPTLSYLTHWGLFLFIFITWMVWESRDWMAQTPLSSLRKLEPYRGPILGVLVILGVAVAGLTYLGVYIAWLVLPLAAWAGILLLRPGQPDAKRIVLFLIGTGLIITLMVEVIVVKGDIGRMNTVFKFYLQVWTMFAVSAAAVLGWMFGSLPEWNRNWRIAWQIPLAALFIGAGLFTVMGGMAKVKDRMVPSAPHTLDGMTYMQYATYPEEGITMDLSQDYGGIRWMQENVQGSPVIVEAKSGDLYRWFTRYTIYTGLPGVIGWQWHEQQQRAVLPGDWVTERIDEVNAFYQTTDENAARTFLNKYNVGYIIVGQLEEIEYLGPGLDKFPELEGILWRTVYHDKSTTIYEVIK